jgi:4-hydroxy-2-oxovalerate aldolase
MVDILECTLRDASYPISYQFTAEDTAIVAAGLYSAGFTRIEIGHGLGLGASGKKYGFAAASDEEYIAAASSVLPAGIFGVFLIPGIANIKQVDLVSQYKGGFVRIGTNVSETNEAESFIKRGKDLGMEVSSNLMKTYSSSVSEVVERSLQLQEWGADIIAVVDSAGGMLPDSVFDYVDGLSNAGIKKVGFHGHNNLQLAVANTLTAIKAGATIVDTTLRGLGRSSGNAQTEAVIMCMERLGYNTGIDLFKMMDVSESLIAPLARGRGSDNIELVSGYSFFHSGYLGMVEKASDDHSVDIRRLILSVGDGHGSPISEQSITESAANLFDAGLSVTDNPIFEAIDSFETNYTLSPLSAYTSATVTDELSSISKKTGKKSVLTVTRGAKISNLRSTFIRSTNDNVIANIEIDALSELWEILSVADENVDFILVDESLTTDLSSLKTGKSRILNYSESNALVLALDAYLTTLSLHKKSPKYLISGINSKSLTFAELLVSKNVQVYMHDDSSEKLNNALKILNGRAELLGDESSLRVATVYEDLKCDIIIGFQKSANETLLGPLRELNADGLVIDASLGSFDDAFIKNSRDRGIPVYRLDMRAALAAEVSLRLETYNLVNTVLGDEIINDIPVVAGGIVGERGAVILDSITSPRKIIGLADGKGGMLTQDQELPFSNRLQSLRKHLLLRRLS